MAFARILSPTLNYSKRELPLQVAGALLSGLLVVLAFPRYGFEIGLDWLVWVALAPLFFSATGSGWRRGLFLGWCTGFLLESSGFCWILLAIRRFTGLPSIVSSLLFAVWATYASIPWALLGCVLGRSRRSSNLWVALAAWVAIEGLFPRLFPWHLGGALYGREWLLQCADLLGASGLTGLIFIWNALVFSGICALRKQRKPPYALGAACAILLTAALLYGRARIETVTRAAGEVPALSVLLVQGALDPEIKNKRGLEHYLAETRRLLQGKSQMELPALIVWPEGADQHSFNLDPRSSPWAFHVRHLPAERLFQAIPSPLVAGSAGYVENRLPEFSNVAFYLEPGKPPRFYEKNRRILFGEHVPGIEWLPESWRRELFKNIGTLWPGQGNPPLRLGAYTFKNLICYEAVLPDYVTESSVGADFLVNITEDVWYGRSAHIPQHVSVLTLRVVENRTPIVRCANMGPSGVFHATGRFERGEQIFAPEGVWAELRPRSLPTFYKSWGRHLPLGALVLVLGGWISLRVRKKVGSDKR